MYQITKLLLAVSAVFFLSLPASAQSALRGTPPEAIEMVQKVKKMYREQGAEATFKAVNERSVEHGFKKADLYPFITHVDGWMAAHFLIALRGLNYKVNLDRNGKVIFEEFMKVVNSRPRKGWANYAYFNPVKKEIEDKSAYIEMLDNEFFVAVGVYGKITNVALKNN